MMAAKLLAPSKCIPTSQEDTAIVNNNSSNTAWGLDLFISF